MRNMNAIDFCKDIYNILENTIRCNEPVNICTKDGNAVLISESDYRGIMETLYLNAIPHIEETIVEGLQMPLSECISEDEVHW